MKVVVVGAGIAGLTAAFRLHRAGCDVTVLERGGPEHVGGRMASVHRDGVYVDLGSPLLARNYRRMLVLAADVGLADHVLPASSTVGVFHRGTVTRGSTGSPWRLLGRGLLGTAGVPDRVRLLWDMRRLRSYVAATDMSAASELPAESVEEYGRRRGFPTEVIDTILDPLNSTLCLGEPADTASVGALFMMMFFAASGGLFTFPTGSGALPRRLAALVPTHFGARVMSVEERPGDVTVVWRSPDGEHQEQADAVILAVPGDRVPDIVDRISPERAAYFRSLTYLPLVQVTFCLDRRTREKSVVFYTGRGDLPDVAAMVLQHNLHPYRVPEDRGLVTVYLRASVSQAVWRNSDDTIVDSTVHGIRKLGVLPEIEHDRRAVHVDRLWPSVLLRRPGEYRDVAAASAATRAASRRVHLAGGDLFGHSTTIGSLKTGEQAAEQVLTMFDRVTT
jgi:protoporphyrinogen/coproporphyrinogen III oxidase